MPFSAVVVRIRDVLPRDPANPWAMIQPFCTFCQVCFCTIANKDRDDDDDDDDDDSHSNLCELIVWLVLSWLSYGLSLPVSRL